MKEQGADGGLDFAWRVHSALDSWTGKVDTKASIVLAIETAILGFIISLSSKDGPLSALQGDDLRSFRTGLVFIGLGILLALAVVVPQLGRRKAKKAWQQNTVYFGHLRRWDVDKLAKALTDDTPRHRQMAEQLVQMSKIAWRKHVWLQWSLASLLVGAICIAWVGL